MRHIEYALLERLLSADRLSTYLRLASNGKQKAADLYLENLNQCQIFHTRLRWLEIGLRNAVNRQLMIRYGEAWYDNTLTGLSDIEQQQVRKAKDTLIKNNKPLNNADIVAALNFGLWVNLFNKPYEDLWRFCLRKAFPGCPKTMQRKELRLKLHPMLKLRNRIAHYEPILEYDLPKAEKDIVDIVRWIEPNMPQIP